MEVLYGSLNWLINEYKKSRDWQEYSPATKKQRENVFKRILLNAGDCDYRSITKQVILTGRDQRLGTNVFKGTEWFIHLGG